MCRGSFIDYLVCACPCMVCIFCCRCTIAVSNGDMMEAYACQGLVTQYPRTFVWVEGEGGGVCCVWTYIGVCNLD